jgi:hypothetical protein
MALLGLEGALKHYYLYKQAPANPVVPVAALLSPQLLGTISVCCDRCVQF